MNVYIGYLCYDNFCDVWKGVEKVFLEESDAIEWELSSKPTENEWREYEEFIVE